MGNIDSHYIFKALQVIKTVPCIRTGNNQVKMLLLQIQDAIHPRKLPCFVGYIRTHSNLPGPLAEGNALADKLIQLITSAQVELAQ